MTDERRSSAPFVPHGLTAHPWDDNEAYTVLLLLRIHPAALTPVIEQRAVAYISECAQDPARVGSGCAVHLALCAIAAHNNLGTDRTAYQAEMDRLLAAVWPA